MNVTIKAIDRTVVSTLDSIFIDTWREPGGSRPDGKYDVILNDAWLEIHEGNIYIVGDIPDSSETMHILIFPNSYSEVVITNPRASQNVNN